MKRWCNISPTYYQRCYKLWSPRFWVGICSILKRRLLPSPLQPCRHFHLSFRAHFNRAGKQVARNHAGFRPHINRSGELVGAKFRAWGELPGMKFRVRANCSGGISSVGARRSRWNSEREISAQGKILSTHIHSVFYEAPLFWAPGWLM